MAASDFYSYLSDVRAGFSGYAAGSSKTIEGSQTHDQKVKLVHLNLLEVCSYVMEKYDPTTTVHMFTADEMRDWMRMANDILDENFYCEFDQFYT